LKPFSITKKVGILDSLGNPQNAFYGVKFVIKVSQVYNSLQRTCPAVVIHYKVSEDYTPYNGNAYYIPTFCYNETALYNVATAYNLIDIIMRNGIAMQISFTVEYMGTFQP
jgi:hypothetical protein